MDHLFVDEGRIGEEGTGIAGEGGRAIVDSRSVVAENKNKNCG